MTPAVLTSLAFLVAMHLIPALVGFLFAALVGLLPWRWARYLIGWGLGAAIFAVANALLYVWHGGPYPGPVVAFALGAIWYAWTARRDDKRKPA